MRLIGLVDSSYRVRGSLYKPATVVASGHGLTAALAVTWGPDMGTARTGKVSGFVAVVVGAMLILVVYRIVFRKTG